MKGTCSSRSELVLTKATHYTVVSRAYALGSILHVVNNRDNMLDFCGHIDHV